MTCVPAPAAKAVLAQATARWPNRNRASDGICPSAAHTKASPTSDHERGMAVDLTHDPANGCDAHAWGEALRAARDPRVKYIISNRRIVASYSVLGHPAWAWRPYSGSNPHTQHCHVSLKDDARNDTSPWFGITPPPPSQPTAITINAGPTYEDDTMQAHFVSLHSGGARLDANGNGYWDVPFPFDKVVTVNPNVANPPEGGYRVPDVGFLRWNDGIRIVAEEAVSGGGLDVVVWTVGP